MKKNLSRGPFLAGLFLSTLVVELYMLTAGMGKPGLAISPLIWLTAGITNAWTGSILIARYGSGLDIQALRRPNVFSLKVVVILIALAAGIWYTGSLLAQAYREIPDTYSDIIPGKREFIRRFLHGETVYVPVQFESYALQPTFLPFRWLPFVIAEILKFDYRWIPFAGFIVGIICWIFSNGIIGSRSSYREVAWKVFLPFAALGAFVLNDGVNFAVAVELLILGYHFILARFLFHRSPWVVGLALVLCLLSRYSIIMWLAVPAFWLIREKRYAFLGKVILTTVAGIFLFYWLPFCRHDLGKHFLAAAQYYIDACRVCWNVDSWLPPGSLPNTIGRGQGFQYWSYVFGPADVDARYRLNNNLGLLSCALTVIASCWLLYRHIRTKNDPIAIQGLLLGSLKVYMIFFIGFVLCPFGYLFIVPFFMSLPLAYSISFKSAFSNQPRRSPT